MPEGNAGNRVLLVEEDDLQRQMIREYLKFMGPYEVLEPGGPYHFLAFCENPMPGTLLVLLDMEWSRVDGVDYGSRIRKRNPILPILGMTDKQADLYCDPRLIGQPIIGLIPKPFLPLPPASEHQGGLEGTPGSPPQA